MSFRWRAFWVHLLICCTVALFLLVLVFKIWYPSPLDVATGVTTIFLIVLICDLILGPLLTLVIANPQKKHLKLDIGIVVLIQIFALCYGLWVVEQGRPVWLVFSVDRFDLVQAYEMDNPYRDTAPEEYRTSNWLGPRWVAARSPENIDERNKLTFEALIAGIDIPQRPDLYIPLEEGFEDIVKKARPLNELNLFNSASEVGDVLKRYPQATDFLPMMSRAKSLTVLIDRNSERIIAVVDLMPWE